MLLLNVWSNFDTRYVLKKVLQLKPYHTLKTFLRFKNRRKIRYFILHELIK